MSVQPWNEAGDGAGLMDRIDGRLPFEARRRAWEANKPKPKAVSFRIDYRLAKTLALGSVRSWVRHAASIAERHAGAPPGSVFSDNKVRKTVVVARLATIHAARQRWPSLKLLPLSRMMDRDHSTIIHSLKQDPAARGFEHIVNAIMQEIGNG